MVVFAVESSKVFERSHLRRFFREIARQQWNFLLVKFINKLTVNFSLKLRITCITVGYNEINTSTFLDIFSLYIILGNAKSHYKKWHLYLSEWNYLKVKYPSENFLRSWYAKIYTYCSYCLILLPNCASYWSANLFFQRIRVIYVGINCPRINRCIT